MATATIVPVDESLLPGISAKQFSDAWMKKFHEHVKRIKDIYRDWFENTSDEDPRGPGAEFFRAVFNLVLFLGTFPISSDLAPFIRVLNELAESSLSLLASKNFDRSVDNPSGHFWDLIDQVLKLPESLESRNKGQLYQLESVADLILGGVSNAQIAKMHGISEDDAMRERNTPGSVCGEGYVPPIFEKHREKQRKQIEGWVADSSLSVIANKMRAIMQHAD